MPAKFNVNLTKTLSDKLDLSGQQYICPASLTDQLAELLIKVNSTISQGE